MPTATRHRLVPLASFLFSQAVVLLILRLPAVPHDGSWLQAFRGYFAFDQLSYAGIASTTASGNNGLPEPFTETGQSFYPSSYYRLLGMIAKWTGSSVPAVWTILGTLVLCIAVAVVGYVGYRISQRAWAPALVGPALTIGTLSVVLHDYWYTSLDSHAVLWGPFGALYALNAEVAGFAAVAIALSIVLAVSLRPPHSRKTLVAWLTLAAALIAAAANLQTYTFLIGTAMAFSWLGAYGLLRARSRALLLTTLAIVVLTFIVGPLVADRIGALPVFALLIACTLPGALWVARGVVKMLVLPAVAFALVAGPQIALVASGVLAKDEFLTYRGVQSGALGVPLVAGVIATLPIGAVWLFTVLAARHRRNDPVLGLAAGLGFATVMLAANNAWGFGQEPYRMWIGSVVVAALMLSATTAWSIAQAHADPALRSRASTRASASAAVILVGLAALDFGGFRQFVATTGVIRFDSSRYVALGQLTTEVDGLMAAEPCIDPQHLKIASRKPVAFFNRGIAWPELKGDVDGVMINAQSGVFDPDMMRKAGVTYLVTDSACPTQWQVEGTMGALRKGSVDYSDPEQSGTLTLWRLS